MSIRPGGTLSRVESAEEGILLRLGRARLVEASGVEEAFRLRGGDGEENIFSGGRAESSM